MTNLREASLARRRILLAEDEYFIMQDLRSGLEALGATVVGPAPSVADALSARGIPFVFATGYSDGMIDARHGRASICEKPVNMRQLEGALVGLLAA